MDNKDIVATHEYDVDTGTYMEDVHSNDFVGIDEDGDGLIDDVELLVEEASKKADEYNAEQTRIREEREKEERESKEPFNDTGVVKDSLGL